MISHGRCLSSTFNFSRHCSHTTADVGGDCHEPRSRLLSLGTPRFLRQAKNTGLHALSSKPFRAPIRSRHGTIGHFRFHADSSTNRNPLFSPSKAPSAHPLPGLVSRSPPARWREYFAVRPTCVSYSGPSPLCCPCSLVHGPSQFCGPLGVLHRTQDLRRARKRLAQDLPSADIRST